MRKKVIKVIFLLVTLTMTSCLDGIHYITRNESGEVEVSFKIVISKILFSMAAEADQDEIPFEEVFEDEMMDPEELEEQFPGVENVSMELINDDADFGFLFNMVVEDLSEFEADTPFIPHIYEDRLEVIPYISESEEDEDGGDEMTMAFLSGAKYKVIVSKSIYDFAREVYLSTPEGDVELTLVDLGDSYLADLPFSYLMSSNIEDIKVVFR